MRAGLDYETYQASGSDEWMMRIGSRDAPAILFLPALFEEMNRTRALVAATMRELAAGGFCCWLPDLTGTGESMRELDQVGWDEWRHDVTNAAAHLRRYADLRAVASMRGGCLLDGAVDGPAWRFAPVEGASLVRDLNRAGLMSGGSFAGYAPSPALLAAIEKAATSRRDRLRTIRLASDRGDADLKVEGAALWRRSEPASSATLAARLSEDISQWAGR